MSEQFLALIPVYGTPVIALTVFLACCGIPLPAAVMMLLGGSLVATGDIPLWALFPACFAAACSGDQFGYWLGRLRGTEVVERLANRGPKQRRLIDRARAFLDRRGVIAIFLTRWLLAMIGPYVNPVAGAAGMRWKSFVSAAVPGQVLWVGGYTLLGYTFSQNIIAVAQIAGNASVFLAAGFIALILGRRLLKILLRILHKDRPRFIKPRSRY
ncbi:DedA family protein [Martelella mediterranea]|uniref:Membrane-associated protein n=1 Tax=Martelella mediterranea TaxID=293089 RepID=A0A4V2V3J3_9HYPH|nr:DedA family protein [Martelella mediterranea]TCT33084.1 membrane-associated protein [Martelella mediterranea]